MNKYWGTTTEYIDNEGKVSASKFITLEKFKMFKLSLKLQTYSRFAVLFASGVLRTVTMLLCGVAGFIKKGRESLKRFIVCTCRRSQWAALGGFAALVVL